MKTMSIIVKKIRLKPNLYSEAQTLVHVVQSYLFPE